MARIWPRVLVALTLGTGILLSVRYRDQLDATAVEQWVTAAGWAAPLMFIAIYAIVTVLFVPGTVVTLAGGALFGPTWGTLYNLAGATLGATLAFLVARRLGGNWLERRLGGRLGRLVRGVEAEGWRFVAFSRLVPLFPFNLLNYALGLTRIPLGQYVVASFVFMLPGAFAYTWLGYAGREAAAGSEDLVQKGIVALALLGTLAFLPRLVGRLRQRATLTADDIRARLEAGEDLFILDVRDATAFAGKQGHIGGAVNIPMNELGQRIADLVDRQERPVVLVARTDRQAAKAAALLTRNGFGDVHIARDGMTAWNAIGSRVPGQPQSAR